MMCDEYVDELVATQKRFIDFLQAEVARLRDQDMDREEEYWAKVSMVRATEDALKLEAVDAMETLSAAVRDGLRKVWGWEWPEHDADSRDRWVNDVMIEIGLSPKEAE